METTVKLRITDVMSAPVVVVRDYDTVWHAVDKFVASGLHHLVVLDAEDGLVGILNDIRVLADWPLDAVGLHRRTLGELLRDHGAVGQGGLARITRWESLRHAGQRMLGLGVDALAVVDEADCVVGVLTGSDLIRSLVAESC